MGFRTVFIKNGERLNLRLDNLEVQKNQESVRIPLADIDNVILEGDQTYITSRVLAKLSEHQIDLIICNQSYMPCGLYLGYGQYHRSAKRQQWQATWSPLQKQSAWTEIVGQKIDNQIEVAKWLEIDDSRIELMQTLRNDLMLGDETNREGHVAKVYFNSIFGQGFTREENCIENACLNYGYAVLRAQVARCVVASGLNPALGIFHCNEYNAFNLVDDLMEPFRPLMDWFVIKYILDNDPYLTYEKRLKLIDFLNMQLKVKNKKVFLNQAIADYINSFIQALENGKLSSLLTISFANVIGMD